MNNLKRKYNTNGNYCPKMNWAVHMNDRWRLVRRLQKTRKLYHVSVVEQGIPYNFYTHALNKDAVHRKYDFCLSIVKVEEVKR